MTAGVSRPSRGNLPNCPNRSKCRLDSWQLQQPNPCYITAYTTNGNNGASFEKFEGHVVWRQDVFGVGLTLFSDDDSGRTLATPLGIVTSRDLTPPTSAWLVAAEDASATDDDAGNTGPWRSGGGEVILLALDMSGRVVDDNRRADDDSPPLMKFSSLSTQASW